MNKGKNIQSLWILLINHSFGIFLHLLALSFYMLQQIRVMMVVRGIYQNTFWIPNVDSSGIF